MIKCIVTDFSRVLLFPKDPDYRGSLNALHTKLLSEHPAYDFWEYFTFNDDLCVFYASLSLPVYIFTSDTIQEHSALKPRLESVFAGFFGAKKLGVNKEESSAYTGIAKTIGVPTSQILYIDDAQVNVSAAKSADCQTVLYSSNADIHSYFKG